MLECLGDAQYDQGIFYGYMMFVCKDKKVKGCEPI